MMHPNLRNSKSDSVCIAQKSRPNYNLYILKKVFVLLLKCELAYSTPAFSQEILIGFKEIAHANSENVTEQIIRATFFSFFSFFKI